MKVLIIGCYPVTYTGKQAGRVAGGLLQALRLFPQSSLASFEILSTIGFVLFLFLIGSGVDYAHLRRQRSTALLASAMSILFPFLMAVTIAHSLRIRFAPDGIGSIPFVLFLGISMSITAFPVLARILEERGLQSTPLGATASMCAAVDDVCAWLLLALGLTLLSHAGETMSLFSRFMWLSLYLAVMLGVVRPMASWVARRQNVTGLSYETLGVVEATVLASAAATEAIGIHPLFGAFLAGICFRVSSDGRERCVLAWTRLCPFFCCRSSSRSRACAPGLTCSPALASGCGPPWCL